MSYGVEFKNLDGHKVIDEENEVVIVSEKGSIIGVRSSVFGVGDSVNNDFGGQWIRVTADGTASGRTKFYLSNVVLTGLYSSKPLLAIRGSEGSFAVLPLGRIRRHNSTSFNAVRFISRYPVDIDYIVATAASLALPAAKVIPAGEAHGLAISKQDESIIFDSRWPGVFSVTDFHTFPVLATSNYIDNGVPFTTVSIQYTPGAFFAIDGLFGFHPVVEQVDQEEEFGATLLLSGGGQYYPSIRQTSGSSILCTMVNTEEGLTYSETGGSVEISDPSFRDTGGSFLVLRYLNF